MFRHAKSRALACCVAMLVLALSVLSASATPTTSPTGTWLTANGHGVVAIAQCGDTLCGRIVGIDREPTEPMPTDVVGHSQCGLTIITNERPAEDGTWLGKITDPRNGNTYQAKLWVDEDGNMHLRGFIGIPLFGSTQIWRKYTGRLTAECGLA